MLRLLTDDSLTHGLTGVNVDWRGIYGWSDYWLVDWCLYWCVHWLMWCMPIVVDQITDRLVSWQTCSLTDVVTIQITRCVFDCLPYWYEDVLILGFWILNTLSQVWSSELVLRGVCTTLYLLWGLSNISTDGVQIDVKFSSVVVVWIASPSSQQNCRVVLYLQSDPLQKQLIFDVFLNTLRVIRVYNCTQRVPPLRDMGQ